MQLLIFNFFISYKIAGKETLMNKVIMMGRLTRDPEYKAGEKAYAHYSIAVDRNRKIEGQPEADFFNCTSFGKQADFVSKYLHKGTKVVIEGTLQNNNYTDKNGNKQYSVQILVSSVEFAESKAAASQSASAPQPTPQPAPQPSPAPAVDDDALPFN